MENTLPPLEILFQDENIIAINKPSGLLVHKSDVDKYEELNAMQLLRDQIGSWVYTLHRLDKPTSGVLLMALNKKTATLLGETFTSRQINKSYLAIVRGFTKDDEVINYPLKELSKKYNTKNTNPLKPAQEAITHYKKISDTEIPFQIGRYNTGRYSLVLVKPITGRSRQIRRHMKHIFHPIIGDTAHGDGKHNIFFREKFNCKRLLLHAFELEFTHPISKETISIKAPLDNTFKNVLNKLNLNFPI